MSTCNFEYLLQLINNRLDLDKQLEVYAHLERCDICRDAIYQISKDMGEVLFNYREHCVKAYATRRAIDTAGSGRMQTNANAPARTAMRRSLHRQ
jgi:hypothetical protein